jgi:hypothetical protein
MVLQMMLLTAQIHPLLLRSGGWCQCLQLNKHVQKFMLLLKSFPLLIYPLPGVRRVWPEPAAEHMQLQKQACYKLLSLLHFLIMAASLVNAAKVAHPGWLQHPFQLLREHQCQACENSA